MSLNLSLYTIEADLAALVVMREQTLEGSEFENCSDPITAQEAQLRTIDTAIREYIAAEIRKADSIADLLLMLDRVAGEPKDRKGGRIVCELDQEIERLRERRDNLRKRAEHIKGIVQAVMSGMEWKPGKPRKIEGVRHTLSLVGNGGKQPVVISDESLVPDEFCKATIELSMIAWKELLALAGAEADYGSARITRVPWISLIAAELEKPCGMCDGKGEYSDPEPGRCEVCGGSGRRGVPGARLAERGESVRVS